MYNYVMLFLMGYMTILSTALSSSDSNAPDKLTVAMAEGVAVVAKDPQELKNPPCEAGLPNRSPNVDRATTYLKNKKQKSKNNHAAPFKPPFRKNCVYLNG